MGTLDKLGWLVPAETSTASLPYLRRLARLTKTFGWERWLSSKSKTSRAGNLGELSLPIKIQTVRHALTQEVAARKGEMGGGDRMGLQVNGEGSSVIKCAQRCQSQSLVASLGKTKKKIPASRLGETMPVSLDKTNPEVQFSTRQ